MNPLERVRSGQIAGGNKSDTIYIQCCVLPVHTGAVLQLPLA